MKTKIFYLSMLLAVMVGGVSDAFGGEIHKLRLDGTSGQKVGAQEYVNGAWTSSPASPFFTIIFGTNTQYNSKFKDCSYDGISFGTGLKMAGGTEIEFTTIIKATVTIVQSGVRGLFTA